MSVVLTANGTSESEQTVLKRNRIKAVAAAQSGWQAGANALQGSFGVTPAWNLGPTGPLGPGGQLGPGNNG
jgi:hypothetical protein